MNGPGFVSVASSSMSAASASPSFALSARPRCSGIWRSAIICTPNAVTRRGEAWRQDEFVRLQEDQRLAGRGDIGNCRRGFPGSRLGRSRTDESTARNAWPGFALRQRSMPGVQRIPDRTVEYVAHCFLPSADGRADGGKPVLDRRELLERRSVQRIAQVGDGCAYARPKVEFCRGDQPPAFPR